MNNTQKSYLILSVQLKMSGAETSRQVRLDLLRRGVRHVSDSLYEESNFPLTNRETSDEIEIIDPCTGFAEEDGLAILKEHGLVRPTYEHWIRFGEHLIFERDRAFGRSIVFLHKPFVEDGRYPLVGIAHRSNERGCELIQHCTRDGFSDRCLIAGVRVRS